jgi:hypothetical protein
MAKAGRPQRQVSDEELDRAKDLAYNGCQNGTIEGLMDWPNDFINKHREIAKILTKKRQERYAWLRKTQFDQAGKNPVSAIFLGKNYLGQADKQEITGKDGAALAPPVIHVMPPTVQPIDTSRTVEPDMADPSDTDPQNQAKNRAETG